MAVKRRENRHRFAAAKAAQKVSSVKSGVVLSFAAAKAAQKLVNLLVRRGTRFAAAKAAQKSPTLPTPQAA